MSRFNWLASYPKSGSTWVRAFLEHYMTGKLDINHLRWVMGDERVAYYQAVSAQPYHTLDLYEWAAIRPAALLMLEDMNRDRKLVLKTHNAWATVGEIQLFPPIVMGPSVYLVRNPLDVVPSFARHTGKPVDDLLKMMLNNTHAFSANLERGAMIGFLSSWNNHVKAWSSVPDTLVVRYEDLQDNPHYWFAEILKQFDLEVNKDRLFESIEAAGLDNLQRQESEHGFSEIGRNDKFFGGTKDKLTPAQVSTVIDSFGEVMAEHGYLDEEVRYGSNY